MKRRLIALCVLAVLFAASVGAGERYKVAMVTKALDSEFWQDLRKGAVESAARLGNVDLTVMAPDREVNVQQQIQIVEDMLTQGIDGLLIAPCGASELSPVMQRAVDEGIPVVLVDTDADWDGKTSYVGTDNRYGGRVAGEHIAKIMNGKGKGALITGIMGHQTHIDRVGGCEDVLSQYPDIKIVAKQPANSQRDLGMTVMENILTANPDLDFVFVTASVMGSGVFEAIVSNKSDCKLVSFDAENELLRAIKDGRVDSLVAQAPYQMGAQGVETMIKVLKGETVPKVINVPTVLVTKDNADEFLK